jgi:hypothetical protein
MAKMNMNAKQGLKALAGYSVSSTMMSVACLGLIGAGIFFVPKQGSLKAAIACPSLTTQSQDASAVLSQDIRAARSAQSAGADQLVLSSSQGDVSYTYDKTAHSLSRTSGGISQTVLTGVDAFSFSLLRRGGADTAFGSLVPANGDDARAVTCRWSCSRTVAGGKLDSENFQMSPVVMRHR